VIPQVWWPNAETEICAASEPDTIEISSDEDGEGDDGMQAKKYKKKASKSEYVPRWTLKERQSKPRG